MTACVEPAEKALAEAVLALRTEVQPLIAKGDYTAVLDKLANLRAPVDNFFDNVMVNAEDPALRQNRLAILNTLQDLFLQVADIRYCNNSFEKRVVKFPTTILFCIDFK